jgi:hypothetical protein
MAAKSGIYMINEGESKSTFGLLNKAIDIVHDTIRTIAEYNIR